MVINELKIVHDHLHLQSVGPLLMKSQKSLNIEVVNLLSAGRLTCTVDLALCRYVYVTQHYTTSCSCYTESAVHSAGHDVISRSGNRTGSHEQHGHENDHNEDMARPKCC